MGPRGLGAFGRNSCPGSSAAPTYTTLPYPTPFSRGSLCRYLFLLGIVIFINAIAVSAAAAAAVTAAVTAAAAAVVIAAVVNADANVDVNH